MASVSLAAEGPGGAGAMKSRALSGTPESQEVSHGVCMEDAADST